MPCTYPEVMLARIMALLALLILAPLGRSQELVLTARAATTACPEGSPERLQALLAEIRICHAFDLKQTIVLADDAANIATELHNDSSRALALAWRAYAAVRAVGPEAARKDLQAAKDILPDDATDATKAQLSLIAAMVHWAHDEPPACLEALRHTLELAERANDNWILVTANILALSIVGWPEHPIAEMQRLTKLAKDAGNPGLVIECQILHSIAEKRVGTVTWTDSDFAAWQADARRIGDRARECDVAQSRARELAHSDVEQALSIIKQGIEAAQLHGDREQLALAYDYASRLHLHLQQGEEAIAANEAAIAAVAGMGMPDREVLVYTTAAQVASLTGNGEAARAYGERIAKLNDEIARKATGDQRARLWRETNQLRHSLREADRNHQVELHELALSQSYNLLLVGGVSFLIVSIASMLLLRDRRRLAKANRNLARSIDNSRILEEERRALAQNLQQLERLDSMGLLAGGFAHDFNNILVSVRGNTQLVLSDPATSASQRQLLDQVILASDRAAALCKDILSYATADPGPKSIVDIREIITSMVSIARAGFGNGVTVTMDLGDTPSNVRVDRAQIEQVMLNLLVNASDAMQSAGHIHLSLDTQTISGKPPIGYWFGEFHGEPREYLAISVLDNGQGMNDDTILRIFDPFFSTRFAGRGLGLATAFSILRRHQGLVEVQSELGKGTQFTVYLPLQDVVNHVDAEPTVILEPQQPTATIAASKPSTGMVLVVDDQEGVCEVARAVLELDGHTVITASSGVEALEVAEQFSDRLDLALLDVTMPGMDGPQLAHYLRAKIPSLLVVMMTGNLQAAGAAVALDAPVIQKPFDLQGLRNTIQGCLSATV